MGFQHRIVSRGSGTAMISDRVVVSQKPAAGNPLMPDAVIELIVDR
jgi:hypothetical protein